jgi:N-acylneuraminate cytidylyltransferase
MIGDGTILAVIPARGGSKRIPRKNVRLVSGKPLIAWTIEEAQKSKHIDRLILSSEDPEIIRIAREWGCEAPFVRPAELAEDDTPGVEPILHALGQLPSYKYVVLLQPTSPLRAAEDIDACIECCHQTGSPACVTVTKCTENPYLMFQLAEDKSITPLLRVASRPTPSQDQPEFFRLNGAVYVALSSWLRISKSFICEKTLGYEMPLGRSLDIDSPEDLVHFVNSAKAKEQWIPSN